MDPRQHQSQQRGNASNIPHNQSGERAPNAEVFRIARLTRTGGTTVINRKTTKSTQPAHMQVALLLALRVAMLRLLSRINSQVRELVGAAAQSSR
jgi:hypothetical protein